MTEKLTSRRPSPGDMPGARKPIKTELPVPTEPNPHVRLAGALEALRAKREVEESKEVSANEINAALNEKVTTDPRFGMMDALARKIAQARTAHADKAEITKLEDQLNNLLLIYENDSDYDQSLAYAIIDKIQDDVSPISLELSEDTAITPDTTEPSKDNSSDAATVPEPEPEKDKVTEEYIKEWRLLVNNLGVLVNRSLIEFANLKAKLAKSKLAGWTKDKLGGPDNEKRRKKIIKRTLGMVAVVGVSLVAWKYNAWDVFDEPPHGDSGVGVDGVDILGK